MSRIIFLQFIIAGFVSVIAEIEMEFTKWPESITAPIGDVVTFECTVRVPGERLAWRWRPLSDDNGRWIDLRSPSDNDKVSSRLVVEIKSEKQAGYYQCVVWYGAVSLASVPGRLSIARIDLSGNSAEKRLITAPLKSTVVLHCKPPISDPPAVLTWWKEDKGKKPLDTPHGVLVLNNVTSSDSGTYSCTATNELSGQVVDLPERIYLRVQHEGYGNVRFLESDAYVGAVSKEGVLTAPVVPNSPLRLWCGIVGTPQPEVHWSRHDGPMPNRAKKDGGMLVIAQFRDEDEGIYSCNASGIRRSWKVVALERAHWDGSAGSVNGTEGGGARVSCGTPMGEPKPNVFWMLNALPISNDASVRTTGSELMIEHVEKRHAGIVQCFACNRLGCSYDAALLTVVPVQISDQEYSAESARNLHFPSQPPKKHARKASRKRKAEMVPPSRPNVTRLSEESVMLSWTKADHGLPILFFKVQYREVNSSDSSWLTETFNIPSHIHSYQVNGLIPDRYYKFRIAAVYSNQDNKQGRASNKFYLQKGDFRSPKAPVLEKATALSPTSIMLNWTWSTNGGVQAEGFYVYYRDMSSAGEYMKVMAPGGGAARSIVLTYLSPDTTYEVKVQAYTAQAPSEFTERLKPKTLRQTNAGSSTTERARDPGSETVETSGSGNNALATAGGAIAGLLGILVIAVVVCRRARRIHRPNDYKEKGAVPENRTTNGYIPAKVPITITANPMHAENGDSGVEMSYMHNNNTGGNDESTLPHARKNGNAQRQYV